MKKKTIVGLIAIAAIVAVVIFAGCVEEDTTVSTPTPKEQNYLPLAKGNTWTYERTVEDPEKVYIWRHLVCLQTGHTYTARGLGFKKNDDIPKKGIEKYTVENRGKIDGKEFWEINISTLYARDGRYQFVGHPAERILWGRISTGETDLRSWVEERINYGFAPLSPCMSGLSYSKTVHQAWFLLEPREDLEVSTEYGLTTITATANRIDILTPAGKFPKCLEVITEVASEDETKKSSDIGMGWTTYSYYAPNVGLVKEVQKDYKGDTTYTLELIDYKLQ